MTRTRMNIRKRLANNITPKSRSSRMELNESTAHACIHNYRVNDRLFAEPIIADENGRSLCPICQCPEPSDPSDRSPHFVRVSIPSGIIKSPIRVRPHRKKSFDPSDSFALSKHCMVGHNLPKNDLKALKPKQNNNLDIKSAAFEQKCHVTVTTRDLQKLALRDKCVAEQRALTLGKRATFNQSLSTAKRATKRL